jgi:hypothetical protein
LKRVPGGWWQIRTVVEDRARVVVTIHSWEAGLAPSAQ